MVVIQAVKSNRTLSDCGELYLLYNLVFQSIPIRRTIYMKSLSLLVKPAISFENDKNDDEDKNSTLYGFNDNVS